MTSSPNGTHEPAAEQAAHPQERPAQAAPRSTPEGRTITEATHTNCSPIIPVRFKENRIRCALRPERHSEAYRQDHPDDGSAARHAERSSHDTILRANAIHVGVVVRWNATCRRPSTANAPLPKAG